MQALVRRREVASLGGWIWAQQGDSTKGAWYVVDADAIGERAACNFTPPRIRRVLAVPTTGADTGLGRS